MIILKLPYQSNEYKKSFRRIYLNLLGSILIVAVLASFLIFYLSSQELLEEQRNISLKIYSQYTQLISELDGLSVSMGSSQTISSLVQEDPEKMEYSSYYSMQRELISYKALNSMIDSLAVYAYDYFYLVGDSKIITISEYQEKLGVIPGITFSQYVRSIEQGTFVSISPRIYAVPLLNISGRNYAVVFLQLKESQFLEMLQEADTRDYSFAIFDRNGQLLSSDVEFDSDTKLSEYRQKLINEGYEITDFPEAGISCYLHLNDQSIINRRNIYFFWVILLVAASFIVLQFPARFISKRRYEKELEVEERLMQKEQEAENSKREMELARTAAQAKTDFLSRMSHDIRTPMNGIVGLLYILRQNQDKPEVVSDVLGKLEVTSNQLRMLLNDILDMSRLESNKENLTSESFDLEKVLNTCMYYVETQADERNITIKIRVEPGIHSLVIGSPVHIERIISNILSNAVKYNKDGGLVSVHLEELPADDISGHYVLKITDTGIGMSDEFLQRIYQPFERENFGTGTKYMGTGLGMAITKELVDLMGGEIKIESQEGKGTEVTVDLFLLKDLEQKDESDLDVEMLSLQGKHIMLAEDNMLNSEIARYLLEDSGATVDCVMDGQEALDAFTAAKEGTYDYILMDIRMPKMNGLEATMAIRSLERADAKTVPIIALSANAFAEDVQECKNAGMNDHVAKPIQIDTLLSVLNKYC